MRMFLIEQTLEQFQIITMSRTRAQIQDCLFSMILFIKSYNTFEIGELLEICLILDKQSNLFEQKNLSRMLFQFISHVFQQSKKSHSEYEYLALMVCESLIYNLYRRNSKNAMNNSIYSNSVMISSSSQIGINDQSTHSIRHYESIDDNFSTSFITFVQDFVSEDELRKKIKQMIDRAGRKINEDEVNQCQRYCDVLLETVQYILNKDGKNDKLNQFQYLKQTVGSKNTGIVSHHQKHNMKKMIGEVNKIIFSNKINRIVFLLQQAKQNVFISLVRIYFSHFPSEDRQRDNIRSLKYFTGVAHSGDKMMLNLMWTYIQSIPNKAQLFQTPKNPLFKLIQSYLHCFFMPTFRQFNLIVSKCCKYNYNDDDYVAFYKACQATINKDLCEFIDELPQDLLQFLRLVYRINLACQQKLTKKESQQGLPTTVLSRVKKLLIYSLLAKSTLIQIYCTQGTDLSKYEKVCSYLINLFFKSSLKKYHQNSGQQNQLVVTLTKCISQKLDERILVDSYGYDDLQYLEKGADAHSYVLEEPVLNHDYELIWEVINRIEFTPKDLKQFQMHNKSQLDKFQGQIQMDNPSNNNPMYLLNFGLNDSTFSPMHRAKKQSLDFNQSIQYLQGGGIDENQGGAYQKQDIDFLTWMTVGGTRDYGSKPIRNRSGSTEKLKQLTKMTILSSNKIKEIQKLYQKYQDIIRQ